MRKIWIIARHEYLTNLRRAGFIIWTLAVPTLGLIGLLIAALFGGSAGDFVANQMIQQNQPIGFVDDTGMFTPVVSQYADQFMPYADETSGRAALADGKIEALLVIPADYIQSGKVGVITRTGSPNVGVLSDSEDFLKTQLLHNAVDPALAERIGNPMTPAQSSLDGSGGTTGGGVSDILSGTMVPYFLALLLVISIFTASGYLMRGVAEEKTSRVIEIVLSSVRAWELLAGKVLGLGALGLTQIAVWIAAAVALSGGALGLLGLVIPLTLKPMLVILSVIYYLLGFLLYAVLMGAGGSLGTTQQESQQIAGMFSFMAAIPMMLIGFIMFNPNATIARVLSWIPFTAPTMMMFRIGLGEVPPVDIVGSIVMCAITVPVVVWLGAKIFRTGLLMYGKRPSIKEVLAILRQA